MYAKLFGSLLMSSIWSESQPTRILWITMMAAANREGEIFGSPIGLAATARLTLEETLAGLERLKSPEQHSSDRTRNPENEGRRIEEISGGWRLLNYVYYRELASAEERRAQWRESKRNLRAAKSTNVSDKSTPAQNVLLSESTPESTTKTRERERFAPPTLLEVETYWKTENLNGHPVDFFEHFENAGWRLSGGRGAVMKDWSLSARRWSRNESQLSKAGAKSSQLPSGDFRLPTGGFAAADRSWFDYKGTRFFQEKPGVYRDSEGYAPDGSHKQNVAYGPGAQAIADRILAPIPVKP